MREHRIKRILVALDASKHSQAALEAATQLAASLQAELFGLFVEDMNLLRAAELPFVRETSLFQTASSLSSQEMERQLYLQARQLNRTLERLATRARVRWSFQIVKGRVEREVLAAAEDADLIALGRLGQSAGTRRRIGSTTQTILLQCRRPVLILAHPIRLGLSVYGVFDGSQSAYEALSVAVRLARREGGHLHVLILPSDAKTAEDLQAELDSWLEAYGERVTYRVIPPDAAQLARLVCGERAGLLVASGEHALLQGEALLTVLGEAGCPVLLVR